MKKGKYWVINQHNQRVYFDDLEEARWYVTRFLKGLAEIHSDNH